MLHDHGTRASVTRWPAALDDRGGTVAAGLAEMSGTGALGAVNGPGVMDPPLLRVCCNVPLTEPNPYPALFYRALAAYGIELADRRFYNSADWDGKHASGIDAVHLHWPERLWTPREPGWGSWLRHVPTGARIQRGGDQLGRILRLSRLVRRLKRGRVRLFWTMHNLEPHDGASTADHLGYRLIARASDLIICHSESAAEDCRRRYRPGGRVVVMFHGNYDGVYPLPRPREVVRRELGLNTDRPLVCCLGGIRPYKGIDVACRAIEQLGGAVQLLAAGRVIGCDVSALRQSFARLPGARLIDRVITNQEWADFAAASDLMLLPYHQVTASGALLAALTLGRSVIAADLPLFREMLQDEPRAGRLFRTGDAGALAAAIREQLAIPESDRSAAVRALADRYAWDRVVAPVVGALRQLHPHD